MASFPAGAGLRRIFSGIAIATLLLPLAPLVSIEGALAQSALYPGAVGLVANAGGEPVLLREAPSFDAAVVSSFPEGTPADIIEGPVFGADGTAWHGVNIGGVTGYMVAGYLAESGAVAEPAPVELAQEAVPAETVPLEAAPVETAPEPVAADGSASPIVTADLNLRTGPSYDDMVLAIVPAGAAVTPTGEWANGFAGVTYEGMVGWVDGAWLGEGSAAPVPAEEAALYQEAVPAPVDESGVVGDLAAPAGEAAYAVDVANLRAGPSEGDEVLRVLPAGGTVTITGASSEGWTPVWYNGTWGFVSDGLLSASRTATPVTLAQEAVPAAPLESTESSGAELMATTLSDVNLRAAPDAASMVLGTVPAGMALTPISGPEAGFYQVDVNGQIGWVSSEYLEVSASYLQKGDRNRGKVEGSEPAGNAEAGSGGIIWPVSGGTWSIMQGYNGSSHQNQDGLWQYYYSLDLVRDDGNTAGQTVYSPVNGTVRWTDPGSGGMSIDMGDGHAVAMFHVSFDGSLQAGTQVSQGQPIGQISGSGGAGFSGSPHLHFTLWTSDDNGNWDREAVPFTGKYSVSGMSFPDTGGSSQHAGTTFNP
jgi:uncharacterized protein YgiM (DUF1202 family)